ncbi:MAG: cell division protein FtsW [Clostridia bacterium]|nr:cell division protein FtsW [Clostridia bacterium]
MKWQFPRKVADKARELWGFTRKKAGRYSRDKEGLRLLGQDIRDVGDSISDRADRKQERLDPIYTEPIHRPAPPEAEDLVLTRGRVDHGFLFIVIALCLFGLVMAFSASSVYAAQYHDDSTYYVKRHVLYLILALVPTIPAILLARPWFWRFFGVFSYGVSVVLLLLVLIIGSSYGSGATRWIQIGPISIQPSEIAKMAVVLVIALIMSKHEREIASRQRFGGHMRYAVLFPMLAFGFICVLVAAEHHLSGIIIIGLMGLVTMYIGGTDPKYFRWLFIIGIVGVCAVLMVSEYAMLRITTWLQIEFRSPNLNPLGSAWQTLQGLNAIGSGGFFGRGLGNSQQKYGYVSQPQNDFIFTIICEELGFVGALGVVLLFGLLVWRGFRIAAKAPDKFSSMVVYGLIIKVALQAILNVAVVTNSIPNTGIALPFFSAGGTSLILQVFEMGIVLSISRFSYQKR